MGLDEGWRFIAVLGCAGVLGTGCYSGAKDGAPGADGSEGGSGVGASDGGSEGGSTPEGPSGQCEGEQGGAIVRRLTTVEYSNTIRDTLSVDIAEDARSRLPADLRADGFSNQANGLLVSFDHIEAYRELAQLVVAQVPDLPGLVEANAECTSFGESCESSFIETMGRQVWRRPVVADEVTSLRRAFTAASEEGDDFVAGAGLVLEAMLQSPQFIYRIEDELPDGGGPGELRPLGDYEVASRLSYLLWSTSPDDTLFDAAAAEELHTDEQIEAQVDRMLADPRARETALRYVGDWLALDGLPSITRDEELYPEFSPELAEAMREETLRVAGELLWDEEAPITALLTADFTWASPELATLYGLEPSGDDWARYELADVPHRLGILTHAGVQAINGHGDEPSLVERGLFLLGGLLCAEVAAPPAQLDTSMSELEEGKSPRFYSEARLENATCDSCHGQFDPMGWAFEPFDGIGQWRAQDEQGNDLREDGWLVVPKSDETVPFDTVEELAQVLSEEERVAECMGVRKPLQFAVGRPLSRDDDCAVDEVAAAAAEGGGSYQALITAIALHPNFRWIRAES